MSSDNSLICFKAISNFTTELGDVFSKNQKSLKLYCRLINKTTIVHDKSIKKHIEAFRVFCVKNREAIISKSSEKLTGKIEYSQRVFIDIIEIFKIANKETSSMIWQHILYISAIVDPSGKAREVLKNNLKEGKTGDEETNFLTDIIDKVEQHVDPDANPMEAVSSIMKSGIFTELIGGMNKGFSDGSLDLGKLMGAVNGMVGQLGEKTDGNPQAEGAMNMLSGLMSSMGDTGNNTQPDLAGMMSGLMSGMADGGGSDKNTQPDLAGMMKGLMSGMADGDKSNPDTSVVKRINDKSE